VPKPKPALNAFPPAKASAIVGMSVHMLNYLARHGYLVPTYARSNRRGKTRNYSYRDLVIARIVQRLLDSGLEISRLKGGITKLAQGGNWHSESPEKALRMLVTDGRSLFFFEGNGTLLDLTRQGQLTFAFVLDVAAAQAEVERNLTPEQLANFSLRNRSLRFA
jgi:DNA-binding transcriptional MerR regulator